MMTRHLLTLHTEVERFATRGAFAIARGAVTEVEVVTVTLSDGVHSGRGECRPYARYGESADSVRALVADHAETVCAAGDILAAARALPPGAAANAVESACVDLLCKRRGMRAWELLGCAAPVPRVTAFTLSVGAPESMAAKAREAARYPLLKVKIEGVKIGGAAALEQVAAVAEARPSARLIIDANESLDASALARLLDTAPPNTVLIEQPLPAGHADALPCMYGPPVCADESLHTVDDLAALWAAGYRAVNVKLDKAGGPVRGLELIRAAKARGFTVMAGCMVGSSLAMAPMVAISMEADVLDLDGPLLLGEDREEALAYDGEKVGVPTAELWG